MAKVPVTVKMAPREVELVEAVAALEGASRSGLMRDLVMERVNERLAPLFWKPNAEASA